MTLTIDHQIQSNAEQILAQTVRSYRARGGAAMSQIVYWRRDLPPLSEQVEGEHELEADSRHVPHGHGPRDESDRIKHRRSAATQAFPCGN